MNNPIVFGLDGLVYPMRKSMNKTKRISKKNFKILINVFQFFKQIKQLINIIMDSVIKPSGHYFIISPVKLSMKWKIGKHINKLILSLIHISEPTRLGMISYAV